MKPTSIKPDLSGERFKVVYHLMGDEGSARARAEDICIEQTVEFPADLVPEGDIREHIFGRIETFSQVEEKVFQAEISFAIEITGFELVQFLNVIYGNISLKPGIQVNSLDLPESLLEVFTGPRFGRDGLRQLLDVPERPLLCTALKPMGLPAEKLAEFAYQFALGGMDMIKDDHGLANQPFSPFKERVKRCSEAVERANRQTGRRCIYLPNVSAAADQLVDNARYARSVGAGGLVITPGLTGLDAMRLLAEDEEVALPIMSHPGFQGSLVTTPHQGISHYALYGQIMRLAGADAIIYPNYGGRFSFSEAECRSLVQGTAVSMGHIKPNFPAPGGGMSLERIPEMNRFYGREVIYLIGGNLHRGGPDLAENTRNFLEIVEVESKRSG